MIKKKFWIIMSCLIMMIVIHKAVYAQISFLPEMLVVELTGEKKIEKKVTIQNEGSKGGTFTIAIDYRRKGNSSLPIDDLVSISPKTFYLKPNETKNIRLVFNSSNEKARGESVLGLFVGEKIQKPLSMEVRTGTPIFIRWNNEKRIHGKIRKVEYELIGDDKLSIGVKIQNTGETHIAPYGIVWLEQKGKRIWQVELKPTQPIFPLETKSLTWEGTIPKLTKQSRAELNVLLFWGTLYGIESVGKPGMGSAKKEMKF